MFGSNKMSASFQKRHTLLVLSVYFLSACGTFLASPTPTVTLEPASSPTATFTVTPTRTFTPTPTATFTPTLTPTTTPTPTPALYVLSNTPLPETFEPITVGNAYLLSGLAEWRIETVTDLEWSPDGLTLAVSDDSEIFLYGVHLREILRTLHPQLDGIVDIEFSPNGRWLMSGSRNGSEDTGYRSNIEMWYGPDWKPLGVRYGAAYGLSSLAFSPNSENFLAAFASPVYEENYVDIWNTTSWQITSTLNTGTVLDIGVSRDSILLASAPDRYAIRIWDFDENSWLYKLYTSFTGAVNTIAFSPAALILASGHYDGVVRIWDMVTGEQIQKMNSDAVVQSLAFSPDGRLLATGGSYENGLVRIWDVQTGELLRILEGHLNGVSQVSFSPNSQFLASGSYDGSLRIWGIRP